MLPEYEIKDKDWAVRIQSNSPWIEGDYLEIINNTNIRGVTNAMHHGIPVMTQSMNLIQLNVGLFSLIEDYTTPQMGGKAMTRLYGPEGQEVFDNVELHRARGYMV